MGGVGGQGGGGRSSTHAPNLPSQVFPSPARALATYTRRVFEQKVQAAVDAVLRPPPPGAGHALLRARLRLMAEVYRKTAGLANDLQVGRGRGRGVCGAGSVSRPVAALRRHVVLQQLTAPAPRPCLPTRPGAVRRQGR